MLCCLYTVQTHQLFFHGETYGFERLQMILLHMSRMFTAECQAVSIHPTHKPHHREALPTFNMRKHNESMFAAS